MEKLVFADPWQGYFDQRGLRTFSHFFHGIQGPFVNKNSRRDVMRLTLDDDLPKVLFMKRFHRPHLKDALAGLRTFGRLISQAGVEWENANHLLQHGIGTYRPLCYGEQINWGRECRSFLLTEQLEATCLLDLVMDRWQDLDRAAQESLVVEMADLARRVHALDISLPDLCVWHIFTSAAAPGCKPELSVIDLHRMIRNARSLSCRIRDLARLQWSMSPRYFDDSLKDLLLSAYASGARTDPRSLVRAVAKHVRTLDKVHPPDRYYRRTEA